MYYIKAVLAFLGLFLFASGACCQVIDARICGDDERNFITKYVEVLRTEVRLPEAAVLSSNHPGFEKLDDKKVIFAGHDSYYYWFRFSVVNHDTTPKRLILALGPLGMRDAELFQGGNGRWTSLGKTGIQYPFIKRTYQYAHYAFPIEIPGTSLDTFYLSMDFGNEYRSYAFVLMDHKGFKKFENRFYFFFGIVIGLLSLFFALNLYYFFSIRDRIHLWYAVYLAALILTVMINDELSEQFFGWDSEEAYKLLPISSIGGLAIAALMHVFQLFLINISREGILFKATLMLKWNLILSAFVHLLVFYSGPGIRVEEPVFYWVNFSTIAGILMIISNCIYSVYSGFKGALFILIGLGIFFIGSLERLLLISTSSYIFPPNLFHIGIILETMTISFALIYRHRLERRESRNYLRERKKLMASFERERLQVKLEIQEKTLKNMSQEIHDSILQHLGLCKLRLNGIVPFGSVAFRQEVSESEEIFGKALRDLQNLSRSANLEFTQGKGIVDFLKSELEEVKRASAYEVSLLETGDAFPISDDYAVVLLRICQEALNNIVKHANASKITVGVDFGMNGLRISIADDGDGFLLNERLEGDISNYGLGIRNMRSRARSVGADLSIQRNAVKGTIVEIFLPAGHP